MQFALLKKHSVNDQMNRIPTFLTTKLERFIRKLQGKTGNLNISEYEECSSQGKEEETRTH